MFWSGLVSPESNRETMEGVQSLWPPAASAKHPSSWEDPDGRKDQSSTCGVSIPGEDLLETFGLSR